MLNKLIINTRSREEFVEITPQVEEIVNRQQIKEGICLIFVPHTTCGILINENADRDVQRDIISHLKKLVPPGSSFRHREGNADAHIKSVLVNSSLPLLIEKGYLLLGRWQGIFLAEFDGPRRREVWVKLVKSS